jgi:outer membrane protein
VRRRSLPLLPLLALASTPLSAETLRDALAKAYQNNPTLTAQRAAQRANDENVPIARAGGRPVLSTSTGLNENLLRGGNSFTTPERQLSASAGVTLPIYQGGKVRRPRRRDAGRGRAGQPARRRGEHLHRRGRRL